MRRIEIIMTAIIIMFNLIQTSESTLKGWTDQPTTMYVERGTTVKIRCVVQDDNNEAKEFSERMWFYNTSSSNPIDEEYIKILNSSAIELEIPKVPEQDTKILCLLNSTQGIMYNDLKVGRTPDKIDSIDCKSKHWIDMSCRFKIPHNQVTVHYDLKYSVKGNDAQIYTCQQPADLSQRNPNEFTCTINYNSYRRVSSDFIFKLEATNQIGSRLMTFDINNFANIIPDKVNQVQILDVKSNNVKLSWMAPERIGIIPRNFDFEVLVNSSCNVDGESKRFKFEDEKSREDHPESKSIPIAIKYEKTIPLDFAYTWYDINIRMKLTVAIDDDNLWSEWEKVQVKTTQRRPDNPPVVDVGSFNVLPGGDVYIYWKQLAKCNWNGENFGYDVMTNMRSVTPTESNSIYAVFRKNANHNINFDEHDTMVSIRSKNSEGVSDSASTLLIPKKSKRLNGPTKIRKKLVNGTYYLTWSPPEEGREEIISYTVFWCAAKTELINQCESSINFEQRYPPVTSFVYSSDETINFAISANSKNSTSGMIWAKCTTASSNEIGKIRHVWIPRLTSTEIEVEWNLDCTDTGIVAGYEIEYCRIKDPKKMDCLDEEKKKNITTPVETTKYTLGGLTPYTTYRIILRMFSNSTMGPPSEKLGNTTLEDAPSEVLNLMARKIGNTTVELYWDPPEHFNGVLIAYDIYYNGTLYQAKPIDNDNQTSQKKITMTNLLPFTTYDIAINACTNKCSKAAKTSFKTTIGAPGDYTKQPTVISHGGKTEFNSSYISNIIKWDEPSFRGGNLDFYELRILFNDYEKKEPKTNIIRLKSKECLMEKMCLNNASGQYNFSVRAVNYVLTPHTTNTSVIITGSEETSFCINDEILLQSLNNASTFDPHGYYLFGNWSPEYIYGCHYRSDLASSQHVLILCLMIISLLIVTMAFYLYRKIKDMKDILVQMPPGLEDLTGEKLKKGKDHSMDKMGKPDLLHNVNIDNHFISNEDEHGQLLNGSMNGSMNGADCSSSLRSESTRSEMENADIIEDVEYTDFQKQNTLNDCEIDMTSRNPPKQQSSFLSSPSGKEATPILISPESIAASTPIVDKYSKPNIIMNPKIPMSTSGYVAAPVVQSTPVPVNSNGYVTHSMFNPIQSSGYTQFNAIRQPTINNDRHHLDKMNLKTPIVATTDQEGLSGYVTHKQLSDYGHNMNI